MKSRETTGGQDPEIRTLDFVRICMGNKKYEKKLVNLENKENTV